MFSSSRIYAKRRCREPLRFAGLSVLLAACSVVANAQSPIALAEALDIAESRAPTLAAARAAALGASEMAVAAGQLPDPVLRAGVDNLPVNGPDAFSLERDFMTMRRIGLMQEYVSIAKRTQRRERGEREAQRSLAEVEMLRAELRTDVASAWAERLYARRSEQLLQGLADEIAMQQQAIEAQLASGKSSAGDVLGTRALLIQARDRILAARRQQQAATAKLARWLGPDAARPPVEDAMTPSRREVASLSQHDFRHIPHLRMLELQIEVAEAEAGIARQNRAPNWTWEVSYQQRGSAYSNMVSVGVSVPLPIARADRQDREVAARVAALEQARALLEDATRRHLAEFDATRVEWQALTDRQRDLESSLVSTMSQRTEAVLAGYRGAQQSLTAVLEARRAEVDARLQILDLEREAARLWARLKYTYLEGASDDRVPLKGTVQ